MQRIEIIEMTPADLKKMLDNAVERAIIKYKELENRPSEYEDVTLQLAAYELNCSERTLRRRIKELNIKTYRIGKRLTLQRKDLKKIKHLSSSSSS